MKQFLKRAALTLALFLLLPQSANAAQLLIPVGEVIGIALEDNTVTVAAFDDELGKAAQKAGLKVGDRIAKIDNTQIRSAGDIHDALIRSDGTVEVEILREGKGKRLHLIPEITNDGPKLGVYLRQGVTGIGTVTWYDPETDTFGALGHGVNTSDGKLVQMRKGTVYRTSVVSVKKGLTGVPGQLMGTLEGREAIGDLAKNTDQGIFGHSESGWKGTALPVAACEEIRTGPACIRSTVQGDKVQEYSVEILKIYPASRNNGRNMLLQVTDPALLEATGGIVQGMGVSYNRDNTGTLNSLQGFGDSPGFSLTKRNPCTCAGTQGTPHSSAMIKLNE